MTKHHRRMGAVAIGALLAPPLISLCASPLASADPTTDLTVGPGDLSYTFGPDTLTINPTDYAFDNYISTSNFDVDLYDPDGLTSKTYDVILTDPGKFQLDITDTGGTITHDLVTNPADFLNADAGLTAIGGALPVDVPAGAVGDVAGGGLLESLAGLFGF
jgi:hypothetical protein